MKILPALLVSSIQELEDQLRMFSPYFNRFSIDIQDGKAVPTTTASIQDIATFLDSHRAQFQNITFDFDLMMHDYKAAIATISQIRNSVRIGNIVVFKPVLQSMADINCSDIPIGLSLNPQDKIEDLEYEDDINSISCIQIMTINAGPQGQSFMPELLNKIDQLRSASYRNTIYIDGGVNKETIPVVLSHKNQPDFACVGSFLTKADDDLEELVKYMKNLNIA